MASDMDVIRADADWPCTCPSEFHEPEKYVNCVLVRVARLTAEVDAAKNLLAVLHRDGGHHTEAVGFVQSCADGEQVRHELLKCAEQAEAALKETQWLLDIEKENHEADIATWTREIEEHRAALAAANEDARDWRRRWTAANERAEKLKEALDVAEKLLIENCIVDGPAAPPEEAEAKPLPLGHPFRRGSPLHFCLEQLEGDYCGQPEPAHRKEEK